MGLPLRRVSTLPPAGPPAALEGDAATASRLAEIGGGGLRHRAARGSIVNAAFMVFVNGLNILKFLIVARLLGADEYGLWGLLAVSFGTLFWLAAVGLDDKYIQQDHPDQTAAFQIAFTLQAMLCLLFTVIALVAIPLFSLLYDEPAILVPGLVLAVAMPAIALQTPMWVFYRRMDFFKQRLLQSVDPVVGFVVTIALAASGLGLWALVIGTLAGSLTAALVAILNSPYRLRLRYETGTLREYATFSWPLLAGSATTVLAAQIPVVVAARSLGAAAVGALVLTASITQYTKRVDDVITSALYPAICAVKDKTDLLFETFSKSNRMALLWGFPFGVAAALFASDFVEHVLGGGEWELAIPLVQVLGLAAAVDQIGFNWTAFARARGETRPIAVSSVAALVTVLAVGIPLLLSDGLPGYAIGAGAGTLAGMAVRVAYLLKIFPALKFATHVARAIVPTVPAVALVLIARGVDLLPSGPGAAVAEGLAYVAVVALVTLIVERSLLREAVGYLKRPAAEAAQG